MNFGQALEALKNGAYVTRKGWNGKNMFLWLKPGTIVREEWCHDPTLLKLARENGGTVEALPTICMKTADNKVLTGWLASQTDMLSNDWEIYFDFNSDFQPVLASADDWDIPDDEKVTSEDLQFIDKDDRFFGKFESTKEKLQGLRNKDVNAEEVIDGLKKEFKMDSDYLDTHKVTRTPEQEFEAKVQNIGVQVLRLSEDKREQFLAQAKAELKLEADTPQKQFILENNFNLFEEYIKGN